MPKIPYYISEEKVPAAAANVAADPVAMTKDLAAQAVMGKASSELGSELAYVADKEDRIKASKMAHLSQQEADGFLAYIRSLQGDAVLSDPEDEGRDATAKTRKFMQVLKEKTADTLLTDKQKAYYSLAMQDVERSAIHEASNWQSAQMNQSRVDLHRAISDRTGRLIAGSDGSPKALETILANHDKQVEMVFGDQNISGQLKIDHMHFEALAIAVQQKFELSNLVADLKVKHMTSPTDQDGLMKAIQEAETPEFLRKNGPDKTRQALEMLTVNWRRNEDAYKLIADDVLGKAQDKIRNNILLSDEDYNGLRPKDIARIDEWREARSREIRRLSHESQYWYDVKVRREKEQAVEKSAEIYSYLIGQITSGKPIDDFTIADWQTKGLRTTEGNNLRAVIRDIESNPSIKSGIALINVYAKKNKFSMNAIENATIQQDLTTQLRKEIFTQKLQGEAITNRTKQLLEKYDQGWFMGIINGLSNMGAGIQSATEYFIPGKPASQSQVMPKRNPGETPQQYLKRIGRE